jgi:hypothetical protein
MKKFGMIVFSGLAALALIGMAALLMFGVDRLLHATVLKSH